MLSVKNKNTSDLHYKQTDNDPHTLAITKYPNNIMECKVCQERCQSDLKKHCYSMMFQKTKLPIFKIDQSCHIHDNENVMMCSLCYEKSKNMRKFHFQEHLSIKYIENPSYNNNSRARN